MNKKDNLRNVVLETIAAATKKEAERSIFGWPPLCMGIYHQPKRPKVKSEEYEK